MKKTFTVDEAGGLMGYLMQKYLWAFTIWLIPMSVVYDILLFIRTRVNFWMRSRNSTKHEEKVADVQAQVRAWRDAGCKQPMCTARPGWKSITLQKQTYKERMYGIRIDMADILSIDEKKRIVLVEPMVTIGQLNDFLVARGWTLPVVPELDDLTIGGLVMGGGIESTSHKYGLFQYICKSFEMIMADGSLLKCTKDHETELFAATPFSYGTLGFLTAVELDIIPYKPYLRLTYQPVYSLDEVVNEFTRATNDPKVESVEGIMYSLHDGVIMSGVFVDEPDPKVGIVNRLGRWYKPWFYKHVERFLIKGSPGVEYIPTVDFYHRHNRSFFWLLPNILPFANNVIFRYLLGWTMPPKFSLLKLMKQNLAPDEKNVNQTVIQDFGYNLHELKEGLAFVDKETKIYPLWLCPTRHCIPDGMEHLSLFKKEDVHVDVGIYGDCPIQGFDFVGSQKRMERYAIERKSYVALYAETQLTRADFDEMFEFNLRTYYKMRKKFNCDGAFPHVYEKISKLGRK